MIIGVLIFIAVTFLSTISLMFFDLIKEKDIYLQNNNLYQNYSERSMDLIEKINELENKINEGKEFSKLQHDLESLKTKNPYLK